MGVESEKENKIEDRKDKRVRLQGTQTKSINKSTTKRFSSSRF